MKKKYFGTDGIRGKFNQFPMTTLFFFSLTEAIKKTKKNLKKVLIGKDTRMSGSSIENDLFNGFKIVGVEVDKAGIISTPMLSYYTKKKKYDLGIMISASHNPYQDNGLKVFNSSGEKLTDDEEIKVEKNIVLKNHNFPTKKINLSSDKKFSEYEENLLKRFRTITNFRQKIVLDCANGSLFDLGPRIFKKLKLNHINYFTSPDGKNINKKCGATFPEELSRLTLKNNADLGISFDGDADRVIFCDNKGQIIDGDFILALLATSLKKNNKLENGIVVSTKMCNLGLREFLKKEKIKLTLSDVGDRYVVEEMKQKQGLLGGEQSGHIIFAENSYCGDGIFTALEVIEILNQMKCSLNEACSRLFKKYPQRLVNLKLKNNPYEILNKNNIKMLLRQNKKQKESEVLLRKSGTENLLRLMVQGKCERKVNSIIEQFVSEIRKIDEK
ncbi:MAG: phosphoglucosamine mutase [Alphaproteobacteria bacterium]